MLFTYFIIFTEPTATSRLTRSYLTFNSSQLRVTAAEPGRVEFELDIKKEHTVSIQVPIVFPFIYQATEPAEHTSRRYLGEYGWD